MRPTFDDEEQDRGSAPAVVKPKRLGPRRDAADQPSASKLPLIDQPVTGDTADDDPYSAANLADLRSSTKAAPPPSGEDDPMIVELRAGEVQQQAQEQTKADPVATSTTLARTDEVVGSLIPTATEIREKKERRRRMALEAQAEGEADDFIALDDPAAPRLRRASDASDEDPRNRSLITKAEQFEGESKWGESRLIHEDEDIAEGFDDFVEDSGRVALGRKGMRQQERDRKRDIEKQIKTAQRGDGGDDDDDDDDEMENDVDEDENARLRAYEASQTKAGSYGHKSSKQREKEREDSLRKRLEVLPKTRPIPSMSDVVARFQNTVKEKQELLAKTKETLEELDRESEEIDKEEVRIKALLKEAGERFERLKAEATFPQKGADGGPDPGRGLESLGGLAGPTTPGPGSGMAGVPHDDYE